MEPAYTFNEFVSACTNGEQSVYVIRGAQETAGTDFNLKPASAIMAFIANDGLEQPKFINSTPWENNPHKEKLEIMTDAYDFVTGKDLGYIAFLYQPKTCKWLIKSFKKNNQPDTRNMAFSELKSLMSNTEEPKDE